MGLRARQGVALMIAALLSALVMAAPADAQSGGTSTVKRYEICWWQTHEPENSFECRGPFRGPIAGVDIPTGECWSTDQQGGTVQRLVSGQWVDLPNMAVQYKPSPYCTGVEEPFVSYVRWRFAMRTFQKTQLRFLIPFNDGIDESSPSIVCVRRIDYSRLCR